MPGDIVMGTTSGILFIPAHLVEELVNSAERSHAKDIFGFAMLERGTCTAAEIDSTVWHKAMVDEMVDFIDHDVSCEKYRGLDWTLEIAAANGDEHAVAELMSIILCLQSEVLYLIGIESFCREAFCILS